MNKPEKMQNITRLDPGFLPLSLIQGISFTVVGGFILVFNIFISASLSISKHMNKRVATFSQNLMVSNISLGLAYLTGALYFYAEFPVTPVTCTFAKIYRKFLTLSNIFIVTLLALDRFITLFFPRVYMKYINKKRVVQMSIASWLIAFTLAISSSFQSFNNCLWMQNHIYDNEIVPVVVLTCVAVIIIIYISLFKTIRKFQRQVTPMTGPFAHQNTQIVFLSTAKVSIIILIVLIIYVPPSVLNVAVMFFPSSFNHIRNLRVAFGILYALNSIINPLIYIFVFPQCRHNMIKLLCFWNKKRVERSEMELKMIIAPYLQTDNATGGPTQPRKS